jgi:predicted PurR-regulated permease PerM
MDGTLGTTNGLLAILAAVAVLEVIALIVASVVGWIIFRNLMNLMQEIRQQVPRLADRLDGIAAQVEDVLVDVKDMSSRTAATAERVQHGFDTAAGAASMAVSSAQMFFGRKASIAAGVARGLAVAYRVFMQQRSRPPRSTDTQNRRRTADDDHSESTTFKEANHGS